MIDRLQIQAMRQEIEKRAVSLARVGRALGRTGGLRGSAIGGLGGAALSTGREALKKDEGQPKNYLRAAVLGGAGGAALGGATGLGARHLRDTALLQAAKGAKPTAGGVLKGSLSRIGTGTKDFAKRQAHGVTGAYGESLTAPLDRKRALLSARLRGGDISATTHAKGIEDVYKEKTLRRQAQKAGITNIPGLAKGVATKPGDTARALWKHTTGGGSKTGVALGVGLPLAVAAPDMIKGDESATGGLSMKQKAVRHGAGLGAGMLTAGLPILPQMLTGGVMQSAAERAAGVPKSKRQPE